MNKEIPCNCDLDYRCNEPECIEDRKQQEKEARDEWEMLEPQRAAKKLYQEDSKSVLKPPFDSILKMFEG